MAKPTTKKQEVLELIKTKFEAIAAGNDYNYSYANIVSLNKSASFEDTSINIRDDYEEKEGEQESTLTRWSLALYAEVDILCKGSDVANIYKYEADLLKCIGTNFSWEGKTLNTDFISSQRNKVDQLGNRISDMTIRIKINYSEKAWRN